MSSGIGVCCAQAVPIHMAATTARADLTGFIPAARSDAGLACEVGQEALEYAAESFSALIKARAQIIASHRELAETQDRIGLQTHSWGALHEKAVAPGTVRLVSEAEAA